MTDVPPDRPKAKFSARDLQHCAEREVRYRKHVYERKVNERKMSRSKADIEIEMMQAIAATLARMADYAEKKGPA